MHKITFILAGLFLMMSGLIGVIAYTTNNQAFVKAEVGIEVNFGNVFPGQSVTESFTITNANNTDYTVTLVPPTDGTTDISPYLTVWADTIQADKWDVNFNVPDVTLADGVAVDYGGTINLALKTPS
jgi:hypothetical protein